VRRWRGQCGGGGAMAAVRRWRGQCGGGGAVAAVRRHRSLSSASSIRRASSTAQTTACKLDSGTDHPMDFHA
jgi:hypothetical protein